MSHEHNNGGLLASKKPKPRASGSASQSQAGRLERPSLFAGMEDDEVEDIASDRVRLLSSLTPRRDKRAHRHTHRPSPSPRRSPSHGAAQTSPWWPRALFAVMALGAVAVLYSFVQVVRQPHAMSARARALSNAPSAGGAQPMLANTGTVPHLEALAPPAAGPLVAPIEEVSAEAVIPPLPSAPPQAAPDTVAHTVTQVPPATPVSTSTLVARAQSDAARLNAPAAAPSPARAATTRESREPRARTNDDVALLEAMMKHASARRAPPSSAEDFQACDARQGADAAVCKARACVQHPTATQCHSDTP